MKTTPYTGRFAPSPTGPLHAGSLVAALASWLDARAHGGQWLVRIEDVDTPRCSAAAHATILHQLAQHGLLPDAAPVVQSQRNALYQQALQALLTQGLAYPCTCSRKQIAQQLAARAQAPQRHGQQVYPGTCRPPPGQAVAQARAPHAWRLNVAACLQRQGLPADAPTRWHDRRLGAQQQCVVQAVGDFVLHRADGLWAYQLAVVVDDAAQGITTSCAAKTWPTTRHAKSCCNRRWACHSLPTCTRRWCSTTTAKNSPNKPAPPPCPQARPRKR